MVAYPNAKRPEKGKLIAVVGPTASGKTKRAVSLCREFGGEIISGDSRQVYRGMNIGTGKDLADYQDVPYHLIDICDCGEKYNLYRYLHDFHEAMEDIQKRGKRVVLCGGSGMYVENALSGIRLPEVPENKFLRESLSDKSLEELSEILKGMKTLHNITDIDTCKRAIRAIEIEEYYKNNEEKAFRADKRNALPLPCVIIGIEISREARRERITRRLRHRLEEGMVDEVKSLLERGISSDQLIYYGLEYKYLTLYITGLLSYKEMVSQLEIAIHQFAKRQMTWFRGMEKRGFKINWVPYDLTEKDFLNRIYDFMI